MILLLVMYIFLYIFVDSRLKNLRHCRAAALCGRHFLHFSTPDTEVLENLQIRWINVPVENVIRVKDAFGRIVYKGFCDRQQQIPSVQKSNVKGHLMRLINKFST